MPRLVCVVAGVRWRSNSRSRQWRIILGRGILTGQTLSHLPQKVLALGKWPAFVDADQRGGEDGAHGAGVDPAIRVPADGAVHGAMVHAGGAADAAEHLLELGAEHGGAAVIDEDDVVLLGAVEVRPGGGCRC